MGDLSKTAQGILSRIEDDSRINKNNKKYINDFIIFLQAKGAKRATTEKYIYQYEKFLKAIGGNVDLLKAERPELERAIADINNLDLAAEEKRKIKVMIKVFYKHFLGEDLYYPKQIAWIKTSGAKNRVLPEDLLSEEEITKLLNAATSLRDRAIIALLYDTGMRIGELVTLRKKDVDTNSDPVHVTVNGKTGMRRVPIMFSVPFVIQYLNSLTNAKPNDPLWFATGTWSNSGKIISDGGIRQRLKIIANKTGIDKRIYPHLFRHSRASNYANKLTEQQLKMFFGWTGDSKMAATYVHLSGRDIDNAVLQANGSKQKETSEEPKLTVKVCPRCKFDNSLSSTFCNRCGSALDIKTALNQANEKKLREDVEDAILDDKHMEDMVHRYLMKKSKGKKRR
jgi:site-specific recombinase XerD/ribosomal protein L40E